MIHRKTLQQYKKIYIKQRSSKKFIINKTNEKALAI